MLPSRTAGTEGSMESMKIKLAISVPAELADAARHAVAQGRAKSVSAYVSAALERYARQESLDDLLAELGPIPEDVQQWADQEIARVAGDPPRADRRAG